MEELEELELRTRLYKLQNEIWFYRIVIVGLILIKCIGL